MIRAIALDDEPYALKILEHFCANHPEVELLSTFNNTELALEYLNEHKVDAMFLDIQMPSVSGVDLYKNLSNPPEVIFTTAYSEFAVEGFNVDAVDYLLKPFKPERFNLAIEKLENRLNNKSKQEQSLPAQDYVWIRADYSDNKVMFDDILLIEGFDDYIKIHLKSEKKLVARITMKKIMEMLPKASFVRVHRSFIVPAARIASIKSKSVVLSDREIPIGKSFLEEVQSFFAGHSN